jgi:hypothetical protein
LPSAFPGLHLAYIDSSILHPVGSPYVEAGSKSPIPADQKIHSSINENSDLLECLGYLGSQLVLGVWLAQSRQVDPCPRRQVRISGSQNNW